MVFKPSVGCCPILCDGDKQILLQQSDKISRENRPVITALDHLFLMSAESEGSCAFIERVTACYRVGAQNSFSKKYIES